MFNVVDQFGMLWDVLGTSEHFEDVERTARRVEYDGDNPIFLIFYWHGDELKTSRRLSIVSDAKELKEVLTTYSFSKKVGIDRVFIALPEKMTNSGGWSVETLICAKLMINHTTQDFGYSYETENGIYTDRIPENSPDTEPYLLYGRTRHL